MSEQKRYTAQEMRELSNKIWDYEKMSSGLELTINEENYVDCEATQNLIAMLRQAADAEEELAALNGKSCPYALPGGECSAEDRHFQRTVELERENAQLNARLAAVVKECEYFESMIARHGMINQEESKNIHTAILRAARGESENKWARKERKEKIDKNEVGNKYRILDAKTGDEKKGKYFCLRIDANDPVERDIVNGALVFYANMQEDAGRFDYADNVRKFIAARGEGCAE